MTASTILYNITQPIHTQMLAYPGDPTFSKECISSLENNDPCNAHHIHMSNHTGTHIDFPSHFIRGGKTSSDFDLKDLMGRCQVIEIGPNRPLISPDDLVHHDIYPGDIVFFKTSNANLTTYSPHYTAMSLKAAHLLRDKKVKIVGIDYLSVDAADDSTFSIHHALLAHDILIVENLNLKAVPAGLYSARIYPLQLADLDGAPVTVSLERYSC